MTDEQNRVAGRPYGGRDATSDDQVPGTRPNEGSVQPPQSDTADDHDTGSRAADDGAMGSGDNDPLEPSPGVPAQPDAPGPEGATDADPPGGSVANQPGRAPDQGGDSALR